jgi:NADPH-dependent glutamate synthase beta subunit-like oxidoreductase/NAD(P)H-flavin reductase
MNKTNTFGFDLKFDEFYSYEGLIKIDCYFLTYLKNDHKDVYHQLIDARKNYEHFSQLEISQFIISLAPFLEVFLAEIFEVKNELEEQIQKAGNLFPLIEIKRQFIQRHVAKKYKLDDVQNFNEALLEQNLLKYMTGDCFDELEFCKTIQKSIEEKNTAFLEMAEQYSAWALYHPGGQFYHRFSLLFQLPQKIHFESLLGHVEKSQDDGVSSYQIHSNHTRYRQGFSLTDEGVDLKKAYIESHYCIWCHNQGKDSCSKGLVNKTTLAFQKSEGQVELGGCPLDQKISEMNYAASLGHFLGALAIAIIDNPMIAATGHRICNDCMKACIYQKQTPVDIPSVESYILQFVLGLPYGFEIYSLLTRWNPLNLERPIARPYSGKSVLVVGMGPAGFTLAHHLLNEGHRVFAIDGLKIEPLEQDILCAPIKDTNTLFEDLDTRTIQGFGGVMEYGITVRWDKNNLKLIRLLLERRQHFTLADGVRFGSQLTPSQAFDLGFNHIALCMGAGRPKILDIPQNLEKGIRTASDFLMTLQLAGAYQYVSLANLLVRLPVVVVGGGLTAIDTATEALAYYPRQVQKFYDRYQALYQKHGSEKIKGLWNTQEWLIVGELLDHAKILNEHKNDPQKCLDFLKKWGGVKVLYRKSLQDSPAYRLNHEEIQKALEEGIEFVENVSPLSIELDEDGWAHGITCKTLDKTIQFSAKTILMALGTEPQTVLAEEFPKFFKKDGSYFQAYTEDGEAVSLNRSSKPKDVFITAFKNEDGRTISYLGDLHPNFSGNVVKAMASAKKAYPLISQNLSKQNAFKELNFKSLKSDLEAHVMSINRLSSNIVELVVHAPLAAQNFKPGQFFRLQNYKAYADSLEKIPLVMEGLALTGAWVDAIKGHIGLVVLEMGDSSKICAKLKVGERVVLMGPTGTPTEIPFRKNVLLIGGGLGNAVLYAVGKALKANGCNVIYFAGYKKTQDLFKQEWIEEISNQVIWCCDEEKINPRRTYDNAFQGNIVEALKSFSSLLTSIDYSLCIGSDRMMHAVSEAFKIGLKKYLKENIKNISSINSPMQCMMKEICGQCLQININPETGQKSYIFSCHHQDQTSEHVDFSNLYQRLSQNKIIEKTSILL